VAVRDAVLPSEVVKQGVAFSCIDRP
jgi:hypothetical protein